MTGRSSSPSNCLPPCIVISSLMPKFLRKSTLSESSPASLCRRCSHGSCRPIAHLSAHGAQRAVPVEFVHEHHFGMRNSRRLRPHLGRNPGRLTTNNAQGGGDITKTSRFRWLCRLLTDGVQPPS